MTDSASINRIVEHEGIAHFWDGQDFIFHYKNAEYALNRNNEWFPIMVQKLVEQNEASCYDELVRQHKSLNSNRRVVVVGCCHDGRSTSLIKSLVKGVEARTGEQVECVMVHKEDIETLLPGADVGALFPQIEHNPEPLILRAHPEIKEPFIETKIKGHIRPYKFHK